MAARLSQPGYYQLGFTAEEEAMIAEETATRRAASATPDFAAPRRSVAAGHQPRVSIRARPLLMLQRRILPGWPAIDADSVPPYGWWRSTRLRIAANCDDDHSPLSSLQHSCLRRERASRRRANGSRGWDASMSSELAGLRTGLAPRRSAVGSLLALPVADAWRCWRAFVAGGLLNFSFENVTEERALILALLTAGCLVMFHHFGHYSRRRQLWQEFGDIAGLAAVALLFDLALLYLLKVNFSRLWVLTSWALVVPAVPLARRWSSRWRSSSATGCSRR